MTIVIADNNPRISYTATSGQTAFPTSFAFFEETDINVYINDTLKTLNTDYTVTGGSGSDGTVTLSTGATAGDIIVLTRDVEIERSTDFPTSGPFQVASLNTELDKVIAMIADMEDLAARGLRLSDSDTSASLVLADKDSRKGTVLAFNSTTGAVEVGPTIADTQSIADIKADIATLADIEDGTVATDAISDLAGITSDVTTAAANISAIQGASANAATATTKASEAAASATAAASSATAAASSATTAAASEAAAETAETNAETAETNASTSATNAATSATSAAASATTATNEANDATAASDDAQLSRDAAEGYKDSAETAKTAAETAKTAAETAKTGAETAKTAAETAQTAAETAETNAATSETNAATSATSASTSASTATTKAAEASTSATNAATSATAAAASQTAAAASASAAAASFDSFDDRYLGVKSADPTTDNDGDALAEGMLYFSSTDNEMKVYDGANWIAASSAGSASLLNYNYTATAGQTTFSGADDNSATLSYTASNLIVTLNGVVLEDGTDYTATNGTSVVLTDGAVVDDELNIVAFKSFTTADMVSATNGGTFQNDITISGDLTVDTNTMFVDSTNNKVGIGTSSPIYDLQVGTYGSDGDSTLALASTSTGTGSIRFGDGTSGGEANAGKIVYDHSNNGMQFHTVAAERMRIDGSGNVGIGTSSPSYELDVQSSSGDAEVAITGSTTNNAVLKFENVTSGTLADIYASNSKHLIFRTNGVTERLRITSSGDVGIGTSSPNGKLHIKDSTDIAMSNGADGQFIIEGNGYSGAIALNATGMQIYQNSSARSLIFGNNETEQMRLDSSGNLLVGKTTTAFGTQGIRSVFNGQFQATATSNEPLALNRLSTNGPIADFYKDSTRVGSISTYGDGLVIGNSNSSNYANIRFTNDEVYPCTTAGGVANNTIDLGKSTARWRDIYTNGAVNTSDQNEKQQIASLTDTEVAAAKRISALFKTFKWNDAVTEKGDNARTHAGVIAQDVKAALVAEGLDAADYAFWCSNTWWETSTDVPAVAAVAEVLDDDGNVVTEAVEAQDAYTRVDTYDTQADAPAGATERTLQSVRYAELMAFVGAATEQRLADIETRLTALEAAD